MTLEVPSSKSNCEAIISGESDLLLGFQSYDNAVNQHALGHLPRRGQGRRDCCLASIRTRSGLLADWVWHRRCHGGANPLAILSEKIEHCPVITQHHLDDGIEDICTTNGQPLSQTEVSIRRLADNSCADLEEQGEICACGPCVMLEYHGDPEATAIDAEGCLHTGDLGVTDKRGYVRITGPVEEMIIRGGENHFPAEIESAMLIHPQILEAAVVGIPDEKWREFIACFFRSSPSTDMRPSDLEAHCRAELSPQKTPNIWVQVKSFPMTGSGKIQKFALRELYEIGQLTALKEHSRNV